MELEKLMEETSEALKAIKEKLEFSLSHRLLPHLSEILLTAFDVYPGLLMLGC